MKLEDIKNLSMLHIEQHEWRHKINGTKYYLTEVTNYGCIRSRDNWPITAVYKVQGHAGGFSRPLVDFLEACEPIEQE